MTQIISSWRLASAGISHIRKNADQRNAFQAPRFEAMRDVARELVEPKALEVFSHLFECAAVEYRTSLGESVIIVPRSGGLMGNPSIVKLFCMCFRAPICDWSLGQADWNPLKDFLFVRHPFTDAMHDVSQTIFVDDRQKLVPLLATSADEAKVRCDASNGAFDEALQRHVR